MEGNFVFSVTTLNEYIKDLLEQDVGLNALTVRGEISNYKAYPSGHHYFSLKDETGALKCVMFKGSAVRLRFQPQNGMKVLAMGRVSVYPRDGAYQLYVTAMAPDGVGDLHAAFEALKTKLFQEGLFDRKRKKALPAYPRKIALVTSPVGAAVRDMLRILKARWPLANVILFPVRVQGTEAAGEISRAIDFANVYDEDIDLIITGRGGGSAEDLWCFNEECVARAIERSEIPVISAVGHEPDVAISDFVADLRAATPSNAAELAVPDQNDVYGFLAQMSVRLKQGMQRELTMARVTLHRFESCRALNSPMNLVEDRRQRLDGMTQRMTNGLTNRLYMERTQFAALAAKLDALSPLKVLGRGYAIPQKGGAVVRSARELNAGDEFMLQLRDGTVPCQVRKGYSHGREES